jgi:hypothetical protein
VRWGRLRAAAMDDDDLRDVNPRFPKAAAGFTLLAGALGVLTATQIVLTVRIFSPLWAVVPYLLFPLGAALVVLARSVFTARPWAALGAIAAGAILAVVSGAWLVFAVMNGFFALYAFWTPAGALLCIAFCAAALAPCLRAEEARRKLRAEGLDIGI